MKLSKEQVRIIIDCCGDDGHSIYDADKLVSCGVPEDLIRAVCKTHKSDLRNPKGTIYTDAGVLKKCTGVYGLELLTRVATELNTDTAGRLLGRGFRARKITEGLRRWADETASDKDGQTAELERCRTL